MRNMDVLSTRKELILFNGVNMSTDSTDFKMVVKAKTVKDIAFAKEGKDVIIYPGTEILVDIDELIAKIDEDYVDVLADEFVILNPN